MAGTGPAISQELPACRFAHAGYELNYMSLHGARERMDLHHLDGSARDAEMRVILEQL
jgi:hypothetical protein